MTGSPYKRNSSGYSQRAMNSNNLPGQNMMPNYGMGMDGMNMHYPLQTGPSSQKFHQLAYHQNVYPNPNPGVMPAQQQQQQLHANANYMYPSGMDMYGMRMFGTGNKVAAPITSTTNNGGITNSQSIAYQTQQNQSVPPTPFDSTYGATLVPSYLLINSPYISTPTMQQPQSSFIQHNSPVKKRNVYPAPPKINFPPTSLKHSSDGKLNQNYIGSDGNKSNRIDCTKNFKKLSKKPMSIKYQILPKGNDEFHTRSLLFEYINESMTLHNVVTNFLEYGPIESAYLVANRDTETSSQSVLLSFYSRSRCLDFYNRFLQKFSEFKTQLKSENLKLSYVLLSYGLSDSPNLIQDHNLLLNHIAERGATRSIAIVFDEPVQNEDDLLSRNLPFLNSLIKGKSNSTNDSNKRYIIDSVTIVNSDFEENSMPKSYVLITFLNVNMAVEVLDYLNFSLKKYKLTNVWFASYTNEKQFDMNSSKRQSIVDINMDQSLQNSPETNSIPFYLQMSPRLYLDDDNPVLMDSLNALEKEDFEHEIIADGSLEVSVEVRDTGLSNVTISELSLMNANEEQSPIFNSFDVNGSPAASQHSVMMDNRNMDYGTRGTKASTKRTFVAPITQSLQNQYTTSNEIAASMGNGAGNRTVFIGNINPRSKVDDICNVVRGGTLEQIKFFREKNICFVTFIEASSASQFYANSFIDPITLHNNTLKVGWGDHSGPLSQSIALAVTIGASRNVYISLPEYAFKEKYINNPEYKEFQIRCKLPSEEQLRTDFGNFGDIEQINFLSDGHCCWINFLKISSAIKLVESVNKNNGIDFNRRYDDRYKDLIFGYGKDRCGNVNKNLVSTKNSRFFRKVKKPSYNIKLQQLEDERKREEKKKTFQSNDFNLKSFGISVDNNEEKSNFYEKANSDIDNLTNSVNELNLELKPSSKLSLSKNEDLSEGESDYSTDIELIVENPGTDSKEIPHTRNKRKNHSGSKSPTKFESCKVSKAVLEAQPPIDPNTISRSYINSQKLFEEKNYTNNNFRRNGNQQANNQIKGKRNKKNKKVLPGSDVMSQYLAQLQHSTFMYAANILGASAEDTEFYE